MPLIRPEQAADWPAVHAVHSSAFPTDAEARLVGRLRANGRAVVSLVAEEQLGIIGHILLSAVTICGASSSRGLGLAPVAVLPARQRRGIGGALIRAGLDACRAQGYGFVVLIGHPEYYPRFGFQRASGFRLANEYGADDAFMVLELAPQSLPPEGGLVQYGPEFAEFA